jgi:phosphoglucosamine mutase
MRKLFGTDGIRGVANVEPMTPELAMTLGGAMVQEVRRQHGKDLVTVFIGKDTRGSSDMLEHALAAGVASMGGEAHLLGIIPTPAVAYLTQSLKADVGVMISASHNPYPDNGIKLFDRTGYKLSDEEEYEIERLLEADLTRERPRGEGIGRVFSRQEAVEQYNSFLKKSVGGGLDLSRLSIVIDCANGAASSIVPSLLGDLGAELTVLNAEPNGVNINHQCGTLHAEVVSQAVLDKGADVGLTFDGDADRVLAVDDQGIVRDGDFLLAIFARELLASGRMANQVVVTTVMANLGLDIALRDLGIELVKTRVGDRYVLEEMTRLGAILGGEQSGHIIFLDHQTTGDGVLSALRLLQILTTSQRPLSQLAAIVEKYPQVLINVPISEKIDPMAHPEVQKSIRTAEEALAESGRILVRSSGTEPLVRVMVEGRDEEAIRKQAEEVAGVIREVLG